MRKALLIALLGVCGFPLLAQKKVLFIVAGQSNAVGQGNAEESVRVKGALEYHYQSDSLIPLNDPVGENALDFQVANTGSAWPAFAQRYQELTKTQVVIAATARGGSSAHQNAELQEMGTWDRTGHRTLMDKAILKIKAAEKKTNTKASGIIWFQGERDANAIFDQKLTPEAYEKTLEDLIGRFRKAVSKKLPFYIVLTGNQQGREPIGNEAVRKAQRNVARRMPRVYIVHEEAQYFAERNGMKDFVHYNQSALNDLGKAVAERIADLSK